MKNAHKIFLIIALIYSLILLALLINYEYATSVIPGWHTTILPSQTVIQIVVGLWLFVLSVGYWMLKLRKININKKLFVAHLLLTLPLPALFTVKNGILDFSVVYEYIEIFNTLTHSNIVLFIAGQLLFISYFIRSILLRKKVRQQPTTE